MTKKEFLRAALFVLLALLMLMALWALTARKTACNYTRSITGFFNEQEDSMDVLFFGSSHMYCSMNPAVLKEETGLESYVLATQQQPLAATYEYMRQALETQQPDYLVLEMLMSKQPLEWASEGVLRDCIDPLPWGRGKAQLIRALLPEEKRGSYYFSLAKYHSRWKELSARDFDFGYLTERDAARGYIMFTPSRASTAAQLSYEGFEPRPLPEENIELLLKMKALADSHGAELVFLLMPYEGAEEDIGYFVSMHHFAEAQGIAFLDYNLLYDELGFDGSSDFFDADHFNVNGAAKATEYFGRWLEGSAG